MQGQDGQCHIELARLEPGDQALGSLLGDGQGNARMSTVKAGEDRREQGGTEARGGADGDPAAAQAFELGDLVDQGGNVSQGPASQRKQELTGIGQGDGARRSMKERGAQGSLEPTDLGTHRRLGDVEAFGGPGEMTVIGDGHEVLELMKLRSHSQTL